MRTHMHTNRYDKHQKNHLHTQTQKYEKHVLHKYAYMYKCLCLFISEPRYEQSHPQTHTYSHLRMRKACCSSYSLFDSPCTDAQIRMRANEYLLSHTLVHRLIYRIYLRQMFAHNKILRRLHVSKNNLMSFLKHETRRPMLKVNTISRRSQTSRINLIFCYKRKKLHSCCR